MRDRERQKKGQASALLLAHQLIKLIVLSAGEAIHSPHRFQ
jgi:hypothetical protein